MFHCFRLRQYRSRILPIPKRFLLQVFLPLYFRLQPPFRMPLLLLLTPFQMILLKMPLFPFLPALHFSAIPYYCRHILPAKELQLT